MTWSWALWLSWNVVRSEPWRLGLVAGGRGGVPAVTAALHRLADGGDGLDDVRGNKDAEVHAAVVGGGGHPHGGDLGGDLEVGPAAEHAHGGVRRVEDRLGAQVQLEGAALGQLLLDFLDLLIL